jgi:hypothetical protein
MADHPHPAPDRALDSGQSSRPAHPIANALVLTLLLAIPALICLHAATVADPDIWWHLRTGEWIIRHHDIPRTDPFSSLNAGKPWQAYSWLFDLLMIHLFQRFGLPGIVAYSAGMVFAITAAFRHLIHRLQRDFSVVVLLTFAACFSLTHLDTPRPWMVTIVFFILELDILMHVRRTGRTRELFWLPLLFALWSNLHIQFIDGLVVLGLAFAESVATRWSLGEKTQLGTRPAALALAASVVATLANPYGWNIYRTAYDLASQSGVLNKISELQAIPFRSAADFGVLFLTLGAAAALAHRHRLPFFELGLLGFGAIVSFRSQRDVWVVVTAAAAILASTPMGKGRSIVRMSKFTPWIATALAALLVVAGFPLFHITQKRLESKLAQDLPADAVQHIQASHYAGPLYNDFTWGGYLIWSLRIPVSLDGRAAFYGDTIIDRSVATWNGGPDWSSDPNLKSAGLVIGPSKAPLTQLLRADPHFRLVYEDKLAAVFIPCR